jgi:C4-dicarboxylate-specific signal transduction histidine kinase
MSTKDLSRTAADEASLPADSIVQFGEPALWEQHRWWIIGAATVVLAQAALITVLMVEHHRRRKAETESRHRLLEVTHLNRTAAGVLSSSFAHKLNQPLAAFLSNAETAEALLAENPRDVGQLKEIIADIIEADESATDAPRSRARGDQAGRDGDSLSGNGRPPRARRPDSSATGADESCHEWHGRHD